MRRIILITCCVLVVCGLSIPAATAPQDPPKPKKEKFGALAYLPSGAGPAMVGAGARANVDLYVNSYTSDADAKRMAGLLLESGPDALLKSLEKA